CQSAMAPTTFRSALQRRGALDAPQRAARGRGQTRTMGENKPMDKCTWILMPRRAEMNMHC
ncbi:MAG: hypothetical protein ACK55Z_22805, partial [bacterium]